ncbi:MAG: zinc transporter ZupT [Bacteroidales bacterium]
MELTTNAVLIALGLTFIAGMSTSIGGLIAFVAKGFNTKFLSASLGLSAGVMLYISFMELLPDSIHALVGVYSEDMASMVALLLFFAGVFLIMIIDFFVPDDKNPHQPILLSDNGARGVKGKAELKRTGVLMALVIGIHNFPEGLAVFAASLQDVDLAIPIVVAIAIHNIPEGIAVSVPIYYATGDKKRAFLYSALAGLAEPIGALVGLLILLPFWSDAIGAYLYAFIAGIMVYISIDELLPSSEKYGHHHYAVFGVVVGMAIMGFGLLLF